MELTIAEENYIKAIYSLTRKENEVSTNTIAEKIETKASSVSDMLRRLSEKNVVDYVKYRGVSLTSTGEKVALQTIRKHRLWEVFLVEKLGFGWDAVHDIAEQLEHIRSAELTERLSAFLNHPEFDPHGDPIPNKIGQLPNHSQTTLHLCKAGDKVEIERVKDGNAAFLQYLERVGLNIGDELTIVELLPFDSSIEVIRPDNQKILLSDTVCRNLYIRHI